MLAIFPSIPDVGQLWNCRFPAESMATKGVPTGVTLVVKATGQRCARPGRYCAGSVANVTELKFGPPAAGNCTCPMPSTNPAGVSRYCGGHVPAIVPANELDNGRMSCHSARPDPATGSSANHSVSATMCDPPTAAKWLSPSFWIAPTLVSWVHGPAAPAAEYVLISPALIEEASQNPPAPE